jgi:hypothetical protein
MLVGLAFVQIVPHAEGIAIPSLSNPRHSIEVVPERDERRRSQGWDVYTPVVGQGGYERLTESDLEDELHGASISQPFLNNTNTSREQSPRRAEDREVELSPSRRENGVTEFGRRIGGHSRNRSRSLIRPHEHPDIHGWKLLRDAEFWNLFLVMCCCECCPLRKGIELTLSPSEWNRSYVCVSLASLVGNG